MPNLASLPHISVAGSIITATHGSGVNNGNLATPWWVWKWSWPMAVCRTFSRENDGDIFDGLVVNVGALGIITKITLAIEPAFLMQQNVYVNLPMAALEAHFPEIVAAGYSVSLFTDWRNPYINEVWIKSRLQNEIPVAFDSAFYGAPAATTQCTPHCWDACRKLHRTNGYSRSLARTIAPF